jgi:large subunit ribosomal protein L18
MSKRKIHTIKRSKSRINYEDYHVLVITKTNKNIYCQLLAPKTKLTLTSFNSLALSTGTKTEKSITVGKMIASYLTKNGIERILVDRNGNLFCGRIKSLVDSIKENSNVII